MSAQMTRPASISFLTPSKLRGPLSHPYRVGVVDKRFSRLSAEAKLPSMLQVLRFAQQTPLNAAYWFSTTEHCFEVDVELRQWSTLTATAAQHRLVLGCWVC